MSEERFELSRVSPPAPKAGASAIPPLRQIPHQNWCGKSVKNCLKTNYSVPVIRCTKLTNPLATAATATPTKA